jgi:hypothetical protein
MPELKTFENGPQAGGPVMRPQVAGMLIQAPGGP